MYLLFIMVRYLILGASSCTFCKAAKILLEDNEIEYHYVDLDGDYDDWRQVFNDLEEVSPLSSFQRRIPIVLTLTEEDTDSFKLPEQISKSLPESLQNCNCTYIGTFKELDELINLIELDDEY